jgi:hypothetical protein
MRSLQAPGRGAPIGGDEQCWHRGLAQLRMLLAGAETSSGSGSSSFFITSRLKYRRLTCQSSAISIRTDPTKQMTGPWSGKTDHMIPTLDLHVEPLQRIVGTEARTMLTGKCHVGQDILLGIRRRCGLPRPAGSHRAHHFHELPSGRLPIGLSDDRPQLGRDYGSVPLGTCVRMLRMKCTRECCQVRPARIRSRAALRHSCASLETSRSPCRPRRTDPARNLARRPAPCLLRSLARLQEAWDGAALARLGEAKRDLPHTCLPGALSIAAMGLPRWIGGIVHARSGSTSEAG